MGQHFAQVQYTLYLSTVTVIKLSVLYSQTVLKYNIVLLNGMMLFMIN